MVLIPLAKDPRQVQEHQGLDQVDQSHLKDMVLDPAVLKDMVLDPAVLKDMVLDPTVLKDMQAVLYHLRDLRRALVVVDPLRFKCAAECPLQLVTVGHHLLRAVQCLWETRRRHNRCLLSKEVPEDSDISFIGLLSYHINVYPLHLFSD